MFSIEYIIKLKKSLFVNFFLDLEIAYKIHEANKGIMYKQVKIHSKIS